MESSIKGLFLSYLKQLSCIIEKTPASLFDKSLAPDMFSLAMNGKIAANFLVRGYTPLMQDINTGLKLTDATEKSAVIAFINDVREWLSSQNEVSILDDNKLISERAGHERTELTQSQFIYRYIIPNFMFHMSMVYAIARAEGVALSKGDFDGIHSYPKGFSFVTHNNESTISSS